MESGDVKKMKSLPYSHCMLPQMMSDVSDRRQAIAEQLATLSKTLRNDTGPESRRIFLRTYRVLLAEADRVIAGRFLTSREVLPDGQNPHAIRSITEELYLVCDELNKRAATQPRAFLCIVRRQSIQ